MDNYFTVAERTQETILIKKSRFISYVSPAESEDDALAFINSIREKHYDATHNTFAYRVGLDIEYQRYNDDGEPSGTAGRPILEVIKQKGIRNVVVVVTRYFGGILLGASGLIQAYSESTAQGLHNAGMIEKVKCSQLNIELAYPWLGKVQSEIAAQGYFIKDTLFTDSVTIQLLLPCFEVSKFKAWLLDATNGQAGISSGEGTFLTRQAGERKLVL